MSKKPVTDLTQEQADSYDHCGCPNCGSFHLQYGDGLLRFGNKALAEIECEECGQQWVEAYLMYGIGTENRMGHSIRTFDKPRDPLVDFIIDNDYPLSV